MGNYDIPPKKPSVKWVKEIEDYGPGEPIDYDKHFMTTEMIKRLGGEQEQNLSKKAEQEYEEYDRREVFFRAIKKRYAGFDGDIGLRKQFLINMLKEKHWDDFRLYLESNIGEGLIILPEDGHITQKEVDELTENVEEQEGMVVKRREDYEKGLADPNKTPKQLEDLKKEYHSNVELLKQIEDVREKVLITTLVNDDTVKYITEDTLEMIMDYILYIEASLEVSNMMPFEKVVSCAEANRTKRMDELQKYGLTQEQLHKYLQENSKRLRTFIPAVDTSIINRSKEKIKAFINNMEGGIKSYTKKHWWTKEVARYGSAFGLFVLFNSISEFIPKGAYTFGFGYKTPCLIGFLPLRHVRSIEIARSGKILKFRADGSVFMAQQHGSDDAIKIEFIMVKTEIWMLMALWLLFNYSSGELKEIPKIVPTDFEKLRSMLSVTQFDKSKQVPSYQYHRTFPLITKNIILPNVYLETVSFEDRIQDGMDVIRCSLMLRTYRKPETIITSQVGDNYWAGFEPKKGLRMYDVAEFTANTAYRVFMSTNPFLIEREWKSKGSMFDSRSSDVYFDVNPLDIASTIGLAIAGYKGAMTK